MSGNMRQLHIMSLCPIVESHVIHFPDLPAMQLNFLALLELSQQKGCQDIGWQIGGAYVHPGIFIHLPAEEAGAICPFLTDDLRPLHQGWIVDHQSAALSTG